MENALKLSKRIWRLREKAFMANSGLFSVKKLSQNMQTVQFNHTFGEYTERIYAYMEKTQRESWCILLIHEETQN